jgi:hypothetical protein
MRGGVITCLRRTGGAAQQREGMKRAGSSCNLRVPWSGEAGVKTSGGAVVKRQGGGVVKRGGAGGGVEGEEPCMAEAPTAELRGGEDSAQGKEGARVAAAWASGLPNDGTNPPGAKNDVGVRPGVNGGIPVGFWAPKGALRGFSPFLVAAATC